MSLFNANRIPQVITGKAATTTGTDTSALHLARPATKSTPGNAPAQNYRAGMPGNKTVTPVQARYVAAIAARKIGSKTNTGAQSWVAKLFGG